MAALYSELAETCRDLADIQLAGIEETRLMEGVNQTRPPHPSRLLSVRDVADRLNVDAKTVRRWRDAGKLPGAVQIGGVVRWRPEDIESFIQEQSG